MEYQTASATSGTGTNMMKKSSTWGVRCKSMFAGAMIGLSIPSLVLAQTATLLPDANQRYLNDAGQPVANGSVTYFIPGTTTKKTVWSNSTETTPATNPVLLDAGGKPQPAGQTFGDGCYQQVVKDSNSVQIWSAITCSTGSGGGGSAVPSVGDGLAVGSVMTWSGLVLPPNYVYASGQALSRVTYSQLLTATTLVQSAAVCTASSTTLAGLTDTTQLPIGAAIEGACISPSTTVVSKSTNSVVMSNPATASLSASIIFFPYGDGDGSSTFNVPNYNGQYLMGRCNANNVTCSSITSLYFGADPNALNIKGGSQSGTLLAANLPPHTHTSSTVTDPGHGHPGSLGTTQGTATPGNISTAAMNGNNGTGATVNQVLSIASNTTGITLSASTGNNASGTSTPFSLLPPTTTVNYIIKALQDNPAKIGLNVVAASRLATTTALPANVYNNGSSGIGATLTATSNGALSIDGVGVATSDQVLIKNEVAQADNGIYIVAQAGDGSHPYVLVRTSFFDQVSEMTAGTYTLITVGTANSGSSWILQSSITTVGTDAIVFNQFSSAPVASLAPPLLINPPLLTNIQGFVVTQSTPNGGSVAGPINLNVITVTDGTQAVTGTVDSFGQIANRTTGFQVNHLVTGGSANHFAIDGLVKATATNGGIVGVVGGTRTETGTTTTGNMWGVIGYGQVAGNSTFNQSMVGVDAEVGIATGSTARDRIGVGSVAFGSVAATTTDASFITYLDTIEAAPFNGAAPFKIGWYLSSNYLGAATFPIDMTGDVIKADIGTVTNFVNAPLLTVSGNILSFPNVQLTGSGNLRLFNTNSAGAFVVSPNSGATNTSFQVDNSLGQGNGVYIFTTAAGSAANITTISTATNEALKINAKGSGIIDLGNTSTGGVTIHGSFIATGLVTNADLVNAATTVNGQTCTLGSTCTVTATASNTLTIGAHLTGTSYNGSAPVTIATDAVSTNTVSTIVARDGSGNFSAGTITASLTGHASLDCALTGCTMSGAITMGTNAITGLTTLASAGAMTFQTNSSTSAGAINTSQQWGIANTSPKTTLDVNANIGSSPALIVATSVARFQAADTGSGGFEVATYGAGSSAGNIIAGLAAGGTAASPTATANSAYMFNMRGYGYNSGAQLGALWIIASAEAWSAGHQGTNQQWFTTPNATTAVAEAMRLQPSGGLSVGGTTDPLIGGLYLNGQEFMPNITTSSAAQTGTVCWTTGTGKFTVDTTVGCLTSVMAAKNITKRLTSARALEIVDRLSPFAFRYKNGWGDGGRYEQFGLGAEEVALVDERLAGRDPNGNLQGVRYQELTAVLVGAIKELKADNNNLHAQIIQLEKAHQ